MRKFQAEVTSFDSKDTKGGALFIVKFSNGEDATTFDDKLASHARNAKGIYEVEIEDTQKGDRVYHNLVNLTYVGPGTGTKPSQSSGGWTPEKEARVTKLSCLNTAATFHNGTGSEDDVVRFAKRLYVEAMGESVSVVAAVSEQLSAKEVVAQVNAEAGQPVISQGMHVTPEISVPWA